MEEYEELKRIIRHHMELYYNEDAPEISDQEYDRLMQSLKAMEREHPEWITADSPTQIVGGSAKRTAGVTVEHDVPMLSIEDVFEKEDVLAWVKEVQDLHKDARFSVEQKIDGLSMSLRYEGGRLILAETRGNGFTGEDVTENARFIPDVALKIPEQEYLEIRGEVYMSHEDFDRTNEKQEMNDRKPFANPRNCAAGTLRQLSPALVKERGLSMLVFNVQRGGAAYTSSQQEGMERLRAMGIATVPSILCHTGEEVLSAIDRIGEERGSLPYDIDGAVIKIDQLSYRDDFPAGTKYSAGHIAYKYPPEEKESIVRDIELSVGMTGRINPTAVFDPVRLCGTSVSRATLHNQDFINELGIGIGRTVIVYKSGEIIPKIKGINPAKNPPGSRVYALPLTCPVCGAPAKREEETADLKCTNPECPARLLKRLVNFVGRDAMDIKGFGTEYIRALMAEGYLKDIGDIYSLKDFRDELVEKGMIGKEKNTDKLLSVIEESKKNPPDRLLAGLGIENVGRASAKTIIRHFGSFRKLMDAGMEELTAVEDVGEVTAGSIRSFFQSEGIRQLMGRLAEAGLTMEAEGGAGADGVFQGRTYVVTGDLSHFKNRNELVSFIEDRGGKVSGSVSKKTYALINNDAASNSGKNKKAKELGIPVITEEELLGEADEG
ncbi:MAG: NAD-dependent DNA ligase LigA [Lachnospiraceae bacterium]|nr:NAD-dependent DNA ligase LigA [Lachnospiraceae bacterium]